MASGNTIELEGTGLVTSELVVQIDGRGVGTFSVRSLLDTNSSSVSNPIGGQQLLTLTVPPAIGAGVITVLTNGGSITLNTGISATTVTPTGDVGDTLATAQVLTLPANSIVNVSSTIGDGTYGANDVDLYQVSLTADEQLQVGLNNGYYSQLRLFDATGKQLATQNGPYVYPNTQGTVLQFTAPAAGMAAMNPS